MLTINNIETLSFPMPVPHDSWSGVGRYFKVSYVCAYHNLYKFDLRLSGNHIANIIVDRKLWKVLFLRTGKNKIEVPITVNEIESSVTFANWIVDTYKNEILPND